MSDSVNHPEHYTSDPSGIECIEVTRHRNFNIGNAIKYLWRAGLKDSAQLNKLEKHIQDLDKAVWYILDEKKRLQELAKPKMQVDPGTNTCGPCRIEGLYGNIPSGDLTCARHNGYELCKECSQRIYNTQSWIMNDYLQPVHTSCAVKQRGKK